MKIGFFEIEDWEKEILQQKFSGHDLFFENEHLDSDNAHLYRDLEVLSVFIYSNLSAEVISKLPKLKLITTRSTGFDHIDMKYCLEHKIAVCNVPEYGTHTVAEHTFALILALSRNLLASVERTKKGEFESTGLTGFDLNGRTLGIIGVGNIGSTVSKIAQGFGMKVVAFTRHPDPKLEVELGIKFIDFETLLHLSDFVSLHVPYNKETHHLINSENISKMKHGSLLINTARGGLIETQAILTGLQSGVLRGVGIDVLEEECQIREERELLSKKFLENCDLKTQLLNHVLLTRDDVIVTPHNAFNSIEALHTILNVTEENILSFIKAKPQNIVSVK